ncbi:hypothetical protein PSM36_1069 [Proteiniphilum saccharofermentans]|uniref:Uncharacterized protein n=1 Tax=Proteiniphilum saccharofermentans TaxID=1642647 RepID=A0A1R3T8H9_9BACT|nr:hypothetical protein PSM36_1069 [Proteiniphilum saccharofermentans]
MKSQGEIRRKWTTELSDYNKRDLHGWVSFDFLLFVRNTS